MNISVSNWQLSDPSQNPIVQAAQEQPILSDGIGQIGKSVVICVVPELRGAVEDLVAIPGIPSREDGQCTRFAPAPPSQRLWSH